eukprot:Em0006g1227a
MSEADKAAYTLRAKQEKGGGSMPGKMDCTGQLLSERRDKTLDLLERRRTEQDTLVLSLPPGKDVVLEKFYFLDIQSLCEVRDNDEARFLPCELAVVEYSLTGGISASYHCFIDPGPIPTGYRYLAKQKSEESHQIPVDAFELAEHNYQKILRSLETFVKPNSLGECPPLFVKRAIAEKVEWCLMWLSSKAGVEGKLTRVYEMEGLIMALNAHLDAGAKMDFFEAQHLLDTTIYDYENCCSWHEERDCKFCSLGTVSVYSYVLSDCLCEKYGVAPTRNHLPSRPHHHPSGLQLTTNVVSRSFSCPSARPQPPCGRGRGRGYLGKLQQQD